MVFQALSRWVLRATGGPAQIPDELWQSTLSHYPFLARTISDVVGREVFLVSSADETAFEVRRILSETGMGGPADRAGRQHWISSGDVSTFAALGKRLFGPEIDRVQAWDPDC